MEHEERNENERIDDMLRRVTAREASVGYGALAPHEKAVFVVSGLEAEVNNGGFDQYFFNSAGDHVRNAVEALRLIGSLQMARIVEEACALFGPGGPSPDRDARQEQLQHLGLGALEALDRRFLGYPEPLSRLLLAYWAEHTAS